MFADSNASDQLLLVLVMRRLKRRSRSTSGRKKDDVSISLLCLPRPLLRRAAPPSLPPDVKVSPVHIASSRPQRSTEVDSINHVEDVEQPGRNGVSSGAGLLGGNGLQNYDRFIDTLLRERSAVKDGGVPPTAADQPRQQASKPRTLKTRLRKRRPLTDNVEHQPNINGFDDSRLSVGATGMIGKPAYDRSLWLTSEAEQFSPAASSGAGMSTYAEAVPGRRSRNELDPHRSSMEMSESDDACGTSTKLDTIEGSPRRRQRQRQRQRYRKKNDRRRGGAAASEECDNAVSQARVDADDLTKKSEVIISSDSETGLATHFDEAVLDRRQPGRGDLRDSCAYRERFDRGDTAASNSPNRAVYKLSGIITATVSNDSEDELSTDFNKAKEDRRHSDEVFGLSVDTSTIQFIDCDNQRVELFDVETTPPSISLSHEDRTMSTSLVADEWRNTGRGNLTAFSTPSLRASSLQFGRHLMGAYGGGILRPCCCPVCRRSSAQYGECSASARRRRQHHSHPLLYHSRAADQTSSQFDKSPGRLTRNAEHRSQLLDTCRCSITWSTTTVSSVEDPEDTDYDSIQSSQSIHGPIQSSVPVENISTAAMPSLPLSDDIKHPLTDRRQYFAVTRASSPSSKVVQLVSSRSRGDRRYLSIDKASVGRRTAQVFCVFGRRRENGRCGCKAARCLLSIRFTLTRSQTEDHKTTLVFAQTKTEERDQVANDALNLPICRCSTCSTSDVISDDSRDGVDHNKRTIELASRCANVESLTVSLPSSEDRTFNISPDLVGLHPAADTADLAADVGTVGDVTTCEITSGDVVDVSQSLMMYEFAEVTSIFRNFADDLLPPNGRQLSLVPYDSARRREDGSTTAALVLRAAPGVTYSGALVPYGTHLPIFFPLPLMTWSWNRDDFTGSHQRRGTDDDVVHIPYVSACKTVNVELSIDHFTLITTSSNGVRSLSLFDRTQETRPHEATSSR